VPSNPGTWLTTAARRKALDALRRRQALSARLPLLVEPDEVEMGARITRAKKIQTARIAYRIPEASELPDRLDAVLTVAHLPQLLV